MLQISQVKMKPDSGMDALKDQVRRTLRLREDEEFCLKIRRKSIDARKKPDIFYVYTLEVILSDKEREKKVLSRNKDKNVSELTEKKYEIPHAAERKGGRPAGWMRPVIVGTGPAGLFCGLALARAGMRPILIERGQRVEERTRTVEGFWHGKELDPESNVQFGEGGAGTFSDGKLNTGVKDPYGRIRFVLDTFVGKGADPDILYSYKPHVGTDVLKTAVAGIRDEIIERGGEVRFSQRLAGLRQAGCGQRPCWDLEIEDTSGLHEEAGSLKSLPGDGEGHVPSGYVLQTDKVVLAIGHSSRDTFRMLNDSGFDMEEKAFAVGLRIQHPQGMIDDALYGGKRTCAMPPSPYKLTHRLPDGRGVYSFCMCPGGFVVNASSEQGALAVNGMSYHSRSSGWANSAIVVTVSPDEIRGFLKDVHVPDGLTHEKSHVLDGVKFQRRLERAAYLAGQGRIPVETFGDFQRSALREDRSSLTDDKFLLDHYPAFKGACMMADVRSILPEKVAASIEEGILAWDRQIEGFADPSALLAGVESRTSSPVRILRGQNLQAIHFPGIYPCGEGAGYAGGITSAAVDGLKVAEAILAEA